MAFGKKMQDVFTLVVEDIKKLGGKFDFFEEARAIDNYLKEAGLNVKSPQFVADLFDELEYKQSSWKPDKAGLLAFFKVLPDRIKKEKVTDDILVKYIPKDKWGEYKKAWASARASYKEKLGTLPLMLSREIEGGVVVSIFLGDIKDRLGVTRDDLNGDNYKYAYSAVDMVIGRDAVLAKIQEKLPTAKVRLLDYPNASCLYDARYEVEIKIKSMLPTLSSKAAVVKALREVGVLK